MPTIEPLSHHEFLSVSTDSDWKKPKRWQREAEYVGERRRILVNEGAMRYADRFLNLIDETPSLDWLLVTNYPGKVFPSITKPTCKLCGGSGGWETGPNSGDCRCLRVTLVRHNLWLGVRVTNQAEADSRIPQLLRVPAAVRFVLCELTGAVDFSKWLDPTECENCGSDYDPVDFEFTETYKNGTSRTLVETYCNECYANDPEAGSTVTGCDTKLDWVIVSGESGPDARPTHPDWVRGVRDQCNAAGVPFWFEGWGDWHVRTSVPAERTFVGIRWEEGMPDGVANEIVMYRVGKERSGRLLDGRTWEELPNQDQEV